MFDSGFEDDWRSMTDRAREVYATYATRSTTARKVSKYGAISGLYFSVFGMNTGKYDDDDNDDDDDDDDELFLWYG